MVTTLLVLNLNVSLLVEVEGDSTAHPQDGDQDEEHHHKCDPGAMMNIAVFSFLSISVTHPVRICCLDDLSCEGFESGSTLSGAFILMPLTPNTVRDSFHPNAGVIDPAPSIVKGDVE